jgi:hypothetical protein
MTRWWENDGSAAECAPQAADASERGRVSPFGTLYVRYIVHVDYYS